MVAVDQAVPELSAYILSNNQEHYAHLGATRLFETMGGKGAVVYMRRAAGAGADIDRDVGFKRAMAEFPEISVAQEVFTAVTNPGSVGGADLALAIQILDGKIPVEKTVLVDPALCDNVSDAGKALIAAGPNPHFSPEWPVSVSIDGWAACTMDQIIACKGQGE